MTDKPATFCLEGVSKRFGDLLALDDINLRVEAGEVLGLIGPSGAGKTTLLKLLGGMYQPSKGRVQVAGHMVHRLSASQLRALRRQTGFIFQSLDLVPELRVVSNVLAGRAGDWGLWDAFRALVYPRRKDLREVLTCLEKVAVDDKMYAKTSHLSGGQQQRVALARVLFQDSDAILADEPVSSVDPARARDLLERLVDINANTGKSIVVSMHNIDLARAYLTRIVGLRNGRIVLDRKTSEISDDDLRELYRLDAEEDHLS